ncbi:transmembrane protein 255A-like [Saccoglossus kowalevskii]|uniref:Transmembrane protein 255A-like n=1 Tax=Saccoglossus kowalevskii TaxID=10224 RepID=A0ABM0MGJ8_SACKO|nr:PREDICTED: transmembrane protein 255A-like [Saccoglossus kowalevskii]
MEGQTVLQPNIVQQHCKEYEEKQRNAMVSCICQILISIVTFAIGIKIYTMVENIRIGAFWPAIVLIIGAVVSMAGVYLKAAGRGWMIAGVILTCIGIAMAFIGAIVDGVGAGLVARTDFSRCSHISHAIEMHCPEASSTGFVDISGGDYSCTLPLADSSCYCCYLYSERKCEPLYFSLSAQPYKYEGVESCGQIQFTYNNLLWASVAFSVVSFFVGVVCAALVCAFKSLDSPSDVALSQYPVTDERTFPRSPTGTTTTVITTQSTAPVNGTTNTPVVIYNATNSQVVAYTAGAITPPPEYVPNPYMQQSSHGMPGPTHGAYPYAPPLGPPPNATPPHLLMYGGEKPPPYSL